MRVKYTAKWGLQIAKMIFQTRSRCDGKTRTQIRPHTVLEDFPLFCPKCKYTCVIRFKDGKIEEIKMPDA
ncbi:cysteine-rich KTR domain-containing protein [Blautia faecicola]